MFEKSQNDLETWHASGNRCAVRHPAWCDPAECTADPAAFDGGWTIGAGGQHRSTLFPIDLTTALALAANRGVAWLTEACSPWPCEPYLWVQVADVRLSMPANQAGRVLDVLSTLVASAQTAMEATR